MSISSIALLYPTMMITWTRAMRTCSVASLAVAASVATVLAWASLRPWGADVVLHGVATTFRKPTFVPSDPPPPSPSSPVAAAEKIDVSLLVDAALGDSLAGTLPEERDEARALFEQVVVHVLDKQIARGFHVEYRVRGARIEDCVVEGASMAKIFRDQVVKMMSDDHRGIAELLRRLRKKLAS
jgi:hypothetical protein